MKGFLLYLWLGGALLFTANTLFLAYVVQPDRQVAGMAPPFHDPINMAGKSSSWGPYLSGHTPPLGKRSRGAYSSPSVSDKKSSLAKNHVPEEPHSVRPPSFQQPTSTARTDKTEDAPPLSVRTPSRPTVGLFPPLSDTKTSIAQNLIPKETNSLPLPRFQKPASQTDRTQDLAPSVRTSEVIDQPTTLNAPQQVKPKLSKTKSPAGMSRQIVEVGRVNGHRGPGLFMFAPPGF